jgi:hypothetical protein
MRTCEFFANITNRFNERPLFGRGGSVSPLGRGARASRAGWVGGDGEGNSLNSLRPVCRQAGIRA